MNSSVTPLRRLGVFKLNIVNVQKKEASSFKGKDYPPKYVVTLSDPSGRMIDDSFKLPLADEKNKYDKKRLELLMKLTSSERIQDLMGKEVACLIEPYEWNDKVLWNPKNYYKISFLEEAAKEQTDLTDEIPW
jgi:hypothetical protein